MNSSTVVRKITYDDLNNNDNKGYNTTDGRVVTNVDQSLYDDLYDFHDIPLDDGLIIHGGPNSMHHGTDEDTDEDINLDYEYGYDYEKIIKDRLKAVNDAFINDSTPANKKNTRVSFDNAVTAFQTDQQVIDEMSTIPDTPPTPTGSTDYHEMTLEQQQQKPLPLSSSSSSSEHEHLSVAKIPLNDTVKKEHPDEFQNKLKEIVAKYDAEHNQEVIEHHTKPHAHFPEDKEDDESELIFLKYKPVKSHSFDETNVNTAVSPPSSTSNSVNGVAVSPKKKATINFEEPEATKTKNNNDNQNTVNSNKNKNNNSNNNSPIELNKTINRAVKSPSPINSSRVATPSNDNNNNNNNNSNFSFSANVIANPSSLKPNNTNNSNNKNHDNSNNSSNRSSPIPSNKNGINIKSEETTNKSDRSENSTNSNDNNNNTKVKVLIERDGKFLYVNSDEYTAKEKARREEEAKKQQQQQQRKPPMLPHPPTRPKTSNGRSNHRQVPVTDNKNNKNNNNNLNVPNAPIRMTHSADGRSRSEQRSASAIHDEKTPDYGQTYHSPYAVSPRRAESQQGERNSKIDRKKREQEEAEEKRRINESAFNAWLENKLNQQRADANKKNNKDRTTSNSSRSDESKTTYESWLSKKKEQLSKDKEYEKKLRELQKQDEEYRPSTREREIAFRRWLKEKLKAKKDAKKQEKVERKKWVATCRRSRKHQRLSQAIELAQIYGYTSYYYTTGFKF